MFLILLAEKPPTDKPVEGECMDGWTDSGSACYWYQLEATWVSWAEAEYTCSQAGGNLASVHSKAENEFIRDFVGTVGNFGVSVWIGLRRNSQGKSTTLAVFDYNMFDESSFSLSRQKESLQWWCSVFVSICVCEHVCVTPWPLSSLLTQKVKLGVCLILSM